MPFKKKEDDKNPKPSSGLEKAKKDFKIVSDELVRSIKKGEDLSDLPEKFKQNMRTEGVL